MTHGGGWTLSEEFEKYQSHFSEYIKKGIKADDVETLYKKVHAAIRGDPSVAKSTKESPKEHKRYNSKKLTHDERRSRLVERLNALNSCGDNNVEDGNN
nr:unnamed protein product [Digitaria exilis]